MKVICFSNIQGVFLSGYNFDPPLKWSFYAIFTTFSGITLRQVCVNKNYISFYVCINYFRKNSIKKMGFSAILILDIFGHFTNARLLTSGIWIPGQMDSKTESYTWIETPYINEHLVCVLESVRPPIRTLFSQKLVICRKNG